MANKEDSRNVAKAVILRKDDKVLLLKSAGGKFSGQWDLPGGHLHELEDPLDGLKREVKEETDLKISSLTFVQKIENLSFYYCSYNDKPIKTSHEHTGFRFFKKEDLDPNKKFEKVALKALEMKND